MTPYLGYGLSLRKEHYDDVLKSKPQVAEWFEVISENFMGISTSQASGRPVKILEQIRQNFPVVLHGTSLSIGSSDPLNLNYLKKLKTLIEIIEPSYISDHICWTGINSITSHDLLPLPYTHDTISHLVDRVSQVQDYLGQKILLENVSSYAEFTFSEMTEWEFVNEIMTRAGCMLLLDVNNIHVSAFNHGFNPMDYLNAMKKSYIGQIHLAGPTDCGNYLIDTHGTPVPDVVWNLYREAIKKFGLKNTIVEWDNDTPPFKELEAELLKAKKIAEKSRHELSDSKHPSL